MDEFAHLVRELNKNDFVAELSDGTMIREKGCTAEIVLAGLREEEDYFTDAMVAVKTLDKAGAMLLIQGNVWGVYADSISKSAADILEYYGIEFEYRELVEKIHEGECNTSGGTVSYEELVEGTDDPMEAFMMLQRSESKSM